MNYEEVNSTKPALALINVYRALGDINDSWDIVFLDPDGTVDRLPDARYGVDQPEYDKDEDRLKAAKPQMVHEEFRSYWRNGHTHSITSVFADGILVASSGQ